MNPKLKLTLSFFAILLVPYALLLGLGKLCAGGPSDTYDHLNRPMPGITYKVSPEVFRELPKELDPQWMMDRGIPQPPGSQGSQWESVSTIVLTNTWENHALFQSWLNQAYGPEHWCYCYESTLDLCVSIGDRLFGLEGVRYWKYERTQEGGHFTTRSTNPSIELTYGYDGSDKIFYDQHGIYFSSQILSMEGAAELWLLLFLALPTLFLFILRRPLSRAFRASRGRNPATLQK